MTWLVSISVFVALLIGLRRWQSIRPPLSERIQHAMDGEFTSRVRKASKGLPATLEFDFLFEVKQQGQVEQVISGLVALGFAAQAEATPESQLIRATVMAAPSGVDFCAYRQQFRALCSPPVVVYLGLGESSYKAAGVNLPSLNEQQGQSPTQA